MSGPVHKLPPEKTAAALALINGWQREPAKAVACPVCGVAGVRIVDRSSRPYTAWFGFECDACPGRQFLVSQQRRQRGNGLGCAIDCQPFAGQRLVRGRRIRFQHGNILTRLLGG